MICTICVGLKNNSSKIDTHHWECTTAQRQWFHIDYFRLVIGKIIFCVVVAHRESPEGSICPNITTEHTMTWLSSVFHTYGYHVILVFDNGS